MSPTRTVTLIRGDGIGPEVADAVLAILEAARAPLAFEEIVVGREADAGRGRRRGAADGVHDHPEGLDRPGLDRPDLDQRPAGVPRLLLRRSRRVHLSELPSVKA